MKFMEKAKRFFTLNAANHDGFTLVELIVVIAILAILAGVAVPAYSGYIEKSKRAGDETLLAAVNKAFASACLDQGTEIYLLNPSTHGQPAVTITDGAVTAVTPFGEAFKLYYAGNESAKFQTITSLVFDWGTYMFVDPANTPSGKVTLSYGGKQIELSTGAISALQGSTFGTEMGGEALVKELTGLTNMVAASGSDMAEDLLKDTAYMEAYAAFMGVDVSGCTTVDQMKEAVGEKIANIAIENGADAENIESWYEDTVSSALVNGMVFYAANGMKDYTVESATALLNSDNIYSSLSNDSATRLAEASLVYGMYAGFVNSEYNKGGATNSTDNPMAAIQAISGNGAHSENFQAYLDSAQGKADVAAYMEAMNVVNSAAGNDAAASVMVNGFADSELSDLLTQVLGK